jgi:hypothetical protein
METKDIAGTPGQSVARIEVFCDAHMGRDAETVRVHFETAFYDADKKLLAGTQQFGTATAERSLADLSDGDRNLVSQLKGLGYRMLEADRKARAEAEAAEQRRQAEQQRATEQERKAAVTARAGGAAKLMR